MTKYWFLNYTMSNSIHSSCLESQWSKCIVFCMLEFYCFGIKSLNHVHVTIAQIIIIAHNLIALFILHVCWSGDGAIRFEQLNLLIKWINEFQAVTRREDEMVMFDVLCGDFNFDNCSPGTYWQIHTACVD